MIYLAVKGGLIDRAAWFFRLKYTVTNGLLGTGTRPAWLFACQEAHAAYPRPYRAAVFHGPPDSLAFLRLRLMLIAGS